MGFAPVRLRGWGSIREGDADFAEDAEIGSRNADPALSGGAAEESVGRARGPLGLEA